MPSSRKKHPETTVFSKYGRYVTRVGTAVTVLLVLFNFGSCSSSPKQPDAELARKNRAAGYTEFGNTYFQDANFPMAMNFFELALRENTAVDNLPGIAKSYNSIGRVYTATGNYTEAEENYRLAMEFAVLAEDSDQIVQTHINRGDLALRRDDPATAKEELERAKEIADPGGGTNTSILYHNLGILYAREGDFTRAVKHIETALTENEKNRRWSELAGNYYMLASIASRQKDFDTAEAHALSALKYDKRAENSPGIAADLSALGRISEHTGKDEDAYQYYLRSLRIHLSINAAPESVDLLDRLSGVSLRTGRTDEAQRFRDEAERIRRQLEER